MQQAMVAEQRGRDATTSAVRNAFVINLVSSTTPVTLTRPDHAGLNRFTFFVSRRREDGRERFRLHMGYFDSQEEAEKLLDIVRGIYPGAWAGLAPGRRLGAASSTAASAAPAVRVPPMAVAAAAVAAPPPAVVPSVTAAPVKAREEAARARAPVAVAATPGNDPQAAARALNNIREAIASLSDSAMIPVLQAATVQAMSKAAAPAAVSTVMAPTVIARAPAAVRAKAAPVQAAPVQAVPVQAAPVPVSPARLPNTTVAAPAADLSDTAALRLLEGSAQGSSAGVPSTQGRPVPASAPASAPTPVGGRAAEPPPREDRPRYAVQLMWSVQPIAMAQVPQLAIFSAYTLYGAEGNRDGRRWYGLRLGFFTDVVSAKQVAHYVRADFSTVSVVPVTLREREQATLAAARTGGTAVKAAANATQPAVTSRRTTSGASIKPRDSEFELIDDKESLTIKNAKPGGVVQLRPGVRVRATRGAPGKRAKQRPPGQVHARSRTRPMTLEETLEILGAGQLQVDDGSGHDAGLPTKGVDRRQRRVDAAGSAPSKLTRLFERLSDRLGN